MLGREFLRDLVRSTTRLECTTIKLHRFFYANLGGTEDWPTQFAGAEEHNAEFLRLINAVSLLSRWELLHHASL
jgi:hypothetical protein